MKPYLIIGQGLAGTMLAWRFHQAGVSFMIVDREEEFTSSKVAGGIITPITGKRMVKSWNVDSHFPVAKAFYQRVEEQLGSKFYHSRPIIRIFQNSEESKLFESRCSSADFRTMVSPIERDSLQGVQIPFGGFRMEGGYLDVNRFLKISRDYFASLNRYRKADIKHDDLDLSARSVAWENMQYNRAVFCEGWTAENNPLFLSIPFQSAKGEVLNLQSSNLPSEAILNSGGFICPLDGNHFRAGSTYQWDELDHAPTASGRERIESIVSRIADSKYQVVDHEAAVRPVVRSKKAFLGIHPEYPQIAIFNGLGAKGVLNGPALSAQMVDLVLHGITPSTDVAW